MRAASFSFGRRRRSSESRQAYRAPPIDTIAIDVAIAGALIGTQRTGQSTRVVTRPVIVTQRLRNTAVYGTPLALNSFCAYFSTDLLNLSGILKALEIETTTILSGSSGNAEIEAWQINHFSRYMLASG
jgi:hypothetical protein